MKQNLIIFTQNALAGQSLLEALSATLVLATYGVSLKVCFQGDAISLLQKPKNHIPQPFKSAYSMIESFEFYDIFPVWIWSDSSLDTHGPISDEIPHEIIQLDSNMLNQFDQVIYW